VLRIKLLTTLFATALAFTPLLAGPLLKKKTDPARISTLIETLKSDPDEKRRKAAADELGGADSRVNPEVGVALVAALQKDASPAVRAEAAASLGQLGQVIPVAGQALEAAAANDPSPVVRLAAKKTLWEYHLNGYRSPKGADGTLTQTVEPPIASPAVVKPAVIVIPVPPPPVAVAAPTAPLVPTGPGTSQLPPVSSPAGPRIAKPSFLTEVFPSLRNISRTPTNSAAPPPILNLTDEPPIAKRPPITLPPFPTATLEPVPPPTIAVKPPTPPAPPKPDYIPTLPPYKPQLPSVVLPPDAQIPTLDPPAPPKIPATLPPLR
jgi:hypothetical protein